MDESLSLSLSVEITENGENKTVYLERACNYEVEEIMRNASRFIIEFLVDK